MRHVLKIILCSFFFLIAHTLTAQGLRPLNLSEVKADGWIKAQIARDWNSGSFSKMWNNSFFPTTLGGLSAKSNVNSKFRDESNRWVYQWNYGEMEGNLADAAVRAMFLADNAALKTRFKLIMDFMVDSIAATQYADSVAYLSANGAEIWGQTCMQRAMLANYEYTGDSRYYEAVKSMVDKTIILWNNKFNQGLTYFGRQFDKKGQMNHSLTYVDILQYLYNKTRDRKYVDFAFRFYNDFTNYVDRIGEGDDGGADASLDNLMQVNRPFYGHAPHTVEHLRMPLWLYGFAKDSVETLSSKYELAVQNIPIKLYQSLSPSKGLITDPAKHESVNGKFSSGDLPYEYCSLTETLHTLCYMNQLFADVESAENVEILFFNSAQGARFPDGKANTYLVCDNVEKAVTERNWRDQYSALHGIRCCNLNAARIAPLYVANMWLKNDSETELYAMLHGPTNVETKIKGVKVRINAQTNYPFDNKINYLISADAPVNFTLKIRNPQWSEETKVEAEGTNISINNQFIAVSTIWGTSQQTISIHFEEKIKLNKLNSPDSKDFYVQKGALIYTFPYTNEKTSTIARSGFPGYFHWDIKIPTSLTNDYKGMRMLSSSPDYYSRDSSYFRYKSSSPFIPEYPFDFTKGKVLGRFAVNGVLEERELIPMGHTTTRRTTFTPTNQLNTLTPVTIEFQGDRSVRLGNSIQLNAIVKSQFNTVISNPTLVWSAVGGSISQDGVFVANEDVNMAIITVSTGNISSDFIVNIIDDTSTNSFIMTPEIAYPTHTNGRIYFIKPVTNILIYSICGTIVYTHKTATNEINLQHLKNGCYLLKANNRVTKIIKNDSN
jgi:uncharacterized protein